MSEFIYPPSSGYHGPVTAISSNTLGFDFDDHCASCGSTDVRVTRPKNSELTATLRCQRCGRVTNIRDSLDEGSPVGKLRDGYGWIVGTRGAAYMGPETVARLLESEDVAVIDPWIIEANEMGTGKGRGRKAPARAVPVGC